MSVPRVSQKVPTMPMLCALLAACGTLELGIEGTATPTPDATVEMATLVATTEIHLATQAALLPPTPTATSLASGAAALATPPPGLVYRVSNGLWLVGGTGQAVQVSDRTNAILSPHADQVLYNDWETNDLWLFDLSTGLRVNLTATPDDSECCYRWWPGRPDIVVFSQKPQELAPVSWALGFLGVAAIDGSGSQVLDEQHHTAGLPALSPDGQTIAYGGGTVGWLYRWETGPEPFDPADFGLGAADGELAIGAPAWSPDGTRLAWMIDAGNANPDGRIAIGVFDMEERTSWMLHTHDPPGLQGWLPTPIWTSEGHLNIEGRVSAPCWSPDGRWLAFATLAQDPAEREIWVARADGLGQEERCLGPGKNPVWGPDGRWLAFSDAPIEADEHWMVEVQTWRAHQLGLPPGAEIAAWVNPPP
jgi:dipeptidyl aminopeptidase/acylaminoacyl peptidase